MAKMMVTISNRHFYRDFKTLAQMIREYSYEGFIVDVKHGDKTCVLERARLSKISDVDIINAMMGVCDYAIQPLRDAIRNILSPVDTDWQYGNRDVTITQICKNNIAIGVWSIGPESPVEPALKNKIMVVVMGLMITANMDMDTRLTSLTNQYNSHTDSIRKRTDALEGKVGTLNNAVPKLEEGLKTVSSALELVADKVSGIIEITDDLLKKALTLTRRIANVGGRVTKLENARQEILNRIKKVDDNLAKAKPKKK